MADTAQLWDNELTEHQVDAMLDRLADEVVRRKLQTPAILMLEMGKPLASVLGQGSLVFAPFAIPFVGFDNFNDYSQLLSKRENVERLLQRIEELSNPTMSKDD